jgi:predicted ATPase
VTFLFTDIEGSTEFLNEVGAQGFADALAVHRRVMRNAFERHGGVEVDTQGDAFFVAFPTAPGALQAAAEAMEGLASGPIRVRMGIHTGTPLVGGEGYVGHDVHRAARIAAVAHGGQVVVSSSTAALVESVRLRDLGEHRLKDLSAPERIYQLGHKAFPPLKSLSRTNLPVPSTPFLGRKRELQEVVALLGREDVRLLTLTGPGGTGKTRLALQAAAEVAERFPGGVTWVSLSSLRDPALLLPAIAQALHVEDEPGQALIETLLARLSNGRLLLLLDNLEHLLPQAAADIARVREAGSVTQLVTSRERLQLSGEQVWAVPPLAEQDGLALFYERACALDPSFVPSLAVGELCERLDNLPLALELAAARTSLFTPAELLERLGQRLDLLKGGRDAHPRQQTLRATIEWSYDLLAFKEQRLLRSLAVFTGGCTLEAAEQVAEADLDTMQSLLDKSLLRRRDAALGSRYWMLETIRAYAAEQLGDAGVAEVVRQRHAEHFVKVVERARDSLYGANEMSARREITPEAPNIVAAAEWARAREEPELLLWLTVSGELVPLPPALQISLFSEAFARSERIPPALLALGYRCAGGLQFILNRLEEARASLRKSAALYTGLNDLEGEALALRMLGGVLSEMGEPEEGRVCLQRALALTERAGGRRSYTVIHHLGELEREHGNPDEAAALLLRSSELARNEGDLSGAANALHGLADLRLSQLDLAAAETHYAEALTIVFDLSSLRGCNYCLRGLACAAALQGQAQRAGRLWGAACAVERESGLGISARTSSQYQVAVAQVAGETFDTAFAEGFHLTLADAVTHALASRQREQ